QAPDRVLAKLSTDAENPSGLEESVETLVQFPDAAGYLHLTWRAAMRRNSAVIQGTKGTLLIDDDRLLLTTSDGVREELTFPAALSAGSHHADWFEQLLPDFVAEVRDPGKRGANFLEAGWCLALTEASYESHRRGFHEVAVQHPSHAPAPVS
ncbi:MAG TPA: hypothetical protein VMU17_03920, partial [Elusimicrobiota bacterium]|nr:hypothetical protein [Elusimicrobiota bacterium]